MTVVSWLCHQKTFILQMYTLETHSRPLYSPRPGFQDSQLSHTAESHNLISIQFSVKIAWMIQHVNADNCMIKISQYILFTYYCNDNYSMCRVTNPAQNFCWENTVLLQVFLEFSRLSFILICCI